MALRTFRILGMVVDATAKNGIPDLRVEAWNRDDPQHIVFGVSMTDARGEFQIAASVDLPGGVVGAIPAVLKVFQGSQLLAATGQTTIPNLLTFDTRAVLQVQPPGQEAAPADKVTVPQVLSAIDFVRLSDFKGLYQEGKDRAFAAGGLMLDTLKNAMSQVELSPIGPSPVRNKDVVHQDPVTARQRLEAQGIVVNQIKPYRKDLESLGTTTSLPRNLKRGDKVDLYEENGVIRAYAVVQPPKQVADPAVVNRLDGDVKTLRTDVDARTAQIDALKAQLTQRDATIASLNSDLASVKRAQSDLAAQVRPERLAALEDSVKKLQDRLPPPR
jgi:hypothetical protein